MNRNNVLYWVYWSGTVLSGILIGVATEIQSSILSIVGMIALLFSAAYMGRKDYEIELSKRRVV